jgi:tRNA(Arg) A34 adenosine deaminase TadA
MQPSTVATPAPCSFCIGSCILGREVAVSSPLHETQAELCLPPPTTDEILSQRLADRVAEFNETTDPAERVTLHCEIRRLREILRGAR